MSSPRPSDPVFPLDVRDWLALRTSARWEKRVATLVNEARVAVFLPTVRRVTAYRGKKRAAQVPLFPGYVFTSSGGFLDNPAIPKACREKVAQVLRPPDPEAFRQELLKVAGLVTDRKLIQERVVGQPGDHIRVVGGPLTGNEGTIVKLKPNKYAVIVEVSLIGARLEVELAEGMISRV
jgi:transcription antitermination factor NusG